MNLLREDFKKTYPNADWVVYDPINNENLYSGIERALGKKLHSHFQYDVIHLHLHIFVWGLL